MREKISEVNFSIDGKWLADFSRTRVEEGDYQHALRILDSLDGMSLEQKIAILKGEKDLVGVNQLDLIDGTPELKKSVDNFYNYKYGSLLKWDNKYYKPYMFINSWCVNDMPEENLYFCSAAKKLTDTFEPEFNSNMSGAFLYSRLQGFGHARSLHYAYHPETDLAYSFNCSEYLELEHNFENGVVLFKEFNEQIPFWVDSYIKKHPKEAIASVIVNDGFLIKSGAEYVYGLSENNSPLKIDNPYVSGDRFYRLKSEEEESAAIEDLRKKIIEYADNDKEYGWKFFEDENGNVLKVPGRAFMHFALKRCRYAHMDENFSIEDINLPYYSPFAVPGLKMVNDDPLHTDCWLGAGLDLEKAYEKNSWQDELLMQKVWSVQDHYTDNEFNIINRGKRISVEGIAVNTNNYKSVPKGQRILVIPNLSVNFEQAFLACDHIVCETGGKLAHLATLGREFDKSIVRIKDATLQFINKKPILVDFETGKIKYDFKKETKIKP